ncbi:MAG: Gfo/Idh/MocA family oxidoreductase [Paludibacteraceae bacterium]|nr:Gfo/Idh/MocA family oxidoreductase [Paludibacteraceae bacterium]
MENAKLKWGIIGAGQIVSRWIRGARQAGIAVEAVAGRTPDRVQAAARAYGIPRVLGCEDLVADEAIDIVYIATPHPAHKQWAVEALRHGKHVLVEKPAAVTAADFREMAETARSNGCFLMEAMWTAFFPAWEFVLRQLQAGRIGALRRFDASFGFAAPFDPDSRLYNPALAGGSLLDVGVYNLHALFRLLPQAPVSVHPTALIGPTGVDETLGLDLIFANGEQARLSSSIRTELSNEAILTGSAGQLVLPVFWSPSKVLLRLADGAETTFDFPIPQPFGEPLDEGFQYEIRHVEACVAAGFIESPVLPHSSTERVLAFCDELFARIGKGK